MGRRLYFAYGSNMDEAQMAFRCPESKLIVTASLPGYQFFINQRGVASIDKSHQHVVHGLLWDITDEDEKNLDRYEGVAKGFYGKLTLTVQNSDGSTVNSLVYVSSASEHGKPRLGYMEKIIRAAADHGIPTLSIKELELWLATDEQST